MEYEQITKKWAGWAAERTQFNPTGHKAYINFAMMEAILEIADLQLPICRVDSEEKSLIIPEDSPNKSRKSYFFFSFHYVGKNFNSGFGTATIAENNYPNWNEITRDTIKKFSFSQLVILNFTEITEEQYLLQEPKNESTNGTE